MRRWLLLGVSALAIMAGTPVSAIISATGPVSMADLNAEFGRGFNLGAYYGVARAPGAGYIALDMFRGTSNVAPGSRTFFASSATQSFAVPNNNRIRITAVSAGGSGGSGANGFFTVYPDVVRHGAPSRVVGYVNCTGGGCGGDATTTTPGAAGAPGIASGGNVRNVNGQPGEAGSRTAPIYGGKGGDSGHGGQGAPRRPFVSPGNGTADTGFYGYSNGNAATQLGGGASGAVGDGLGGGGGGGGAMAVWEGYIAPGTVLTIVAGDNTGARYFTYQNVQGWVFVPENPGGFVTIEWS